MPWIHEDGILGQGGRLWCRALTTRIRSDVGGRSGRRGLRLRSTAEGRDLADRQRQNPRLATTSFSETRGLGDRTNHHRPPTGARAEPLKRRDVLRSLASAAAAGSAAAVAGSAAAQGGRAPTLSPGAVAEMMRARGLEPQPGEAVQVLSFLLSTRPRALVDPRVEPSIRLDPGMD